MEDRDEPLVAGFVTPGGEHGAHGLEVQPDREVRPLGRHHHDTHRGVVRQQIHGLGQVPPQVQTHGIAGLGPVQPQGGDALIFVVLDAEHG